ncbi:hypothetical protein [Acidovorax sp. sic0104]|uniref:hypothetical protein n=1 Tax=Acidovorax sp. sic0104 TaxID=2854784 RepID=UPI001C47E5DE|nr:hypothetical protein [Acidovorax sp. sic0104]MBV7539744.1 hypothetical protein [Acidovorax sp. sic0104]
MNQPSLPSTHAADAPDHSRPAGVWARWRLALAVGMVGVGAACMDGYPEQDAPALDPFAMTQGQRLAHMNVLGGEAHAERRWSYVLLPGCVLRIDVDGEAGPRPSFDIPLLGAAVTLANDRADATFDVNVATGRAHTDDAAVSVLEAQNWVHASGMQLLLRVLQKGCVDAQNAQNTARS